MHLYRELSISAQTAYAELFEMVQVAEAARSPAFVTGTIARKMIKGSQYAYLAFKEIDGIKREFYLGPDGPAITAIEEARQRGAPAIEAVRRQAAAAVAQGCVVTPPLHFRIVKRLADYQFFRAGGLLVGTHAFLAMGNQLGVAWGSGTRTLDLDFAHQGRGGNVDVALPANLRVDTDDALKSLQIGFLPALGGSKGLAAQYASQREPGLRIDFLTAKRRSDQPVAMPDLGVSLEPLKFMEYLMEGSGQGVLLDREDAAVVNLPDPARYGLHKLLVAYERGAANPKHDKDILQALALIEWHLARSPRALNVAWDDLISRGPGWAKRAKASLNRAPEAQHELVVRFAAAMKIGK